MSDQEEIAGESNPFVELAKARAWIDEAAAELTRIRADLAAAQEERDKLAERSRLYDAALDRLSDYANQLAAAQEREQRMREALEKIAKYLPSFDYVGRDEYGIRTDFPGSPYDRGKADASKHLSDIARAALSAMRGEP